MIKKRVFLLILFLFGILPFISAGIDRPCDLDVSLVSQDPYPAMPGDYVKLVFQVDGIADEDCGEVTLELEEKFPISFDPGQPSKLGVDSGYYTRTFKSFFIVPYKVRVDENALDDENPVTVTLDSNIGTVKYDFNLTVEDSRVDFEIYVKDYDLATNIMTFEILNIGENDVEALTLKIPKQDNLEIKGPNVNVVGDLDSNEYTDAEFEAISSGGDIEIEILYTDGINVRRTTKSVVNFEPDYFIGRKADEKKSPVGSYVVIAVIVILIVWFVIRRMKRKKRKRGER